MSVIADDSASSGPHSFPTNQLAVLNREVEPPVLEPSLRASDKVGVCVKPLHFSYGRTLELLEFLELNKLLGVTKFTLYNHTVSREVACVLQVNP